MGVEPAAGPGPEPPEPPEPEPEEESENTEPLRFIATVVVKLTSGEAERMQSRVT
jgi:hypothetical protein